MRNTSQICSRAVISIGIVVSIGVVVSIGIVLAVLALSAAPAQAGARWSDWNENAPRLARP